MDPYAAVSTKHTLQTEQAREDEVQNAAGGYVFAVDLQTMVHRFLTIGTEGGTYYTDEKELTRDAAKAVIKAAQTNGVGLVEQIVEVSVAGRAPKQNPALFALAIAASLSDDDGRKAALAALPKVARTGSAFLQFVGYVEQFRGWGRGLRTAVRNWYDDKPVEALAYQILKYRQRGGWSQRDVLRLAHIKPDEDQSLLFGEAVGKLSAEMELAPDHVAWPDSLSLLGAYKKAQATTDVQSWVQLVSDYPLSWEMLPDAALKQPKVWAAMIERGMPTTALMRNLGRLSSLGVLTSTGSATKTVVKQLGNVELLQKARIHPLNVLVAARTYASGHGLRGKLSWTVVQKIVDALDKAFYASYAAVEPANKRTLVAVDVSGSMGVFAGGMPCTAREIAGALALVSAVTEPDVTLVAFSHDLVDLPISPRQRLDDVLKTMVKIPYGRTDCSLPARWAAEKGLQFDTIQIITDSETWYGRVHPYQALEAYRQQSEYPVRQVVTAITGTGTTVADPKDSLSLDISGFDSSVPTLMADFSRGDL